MSLRFRRSMKIAPGVRLNFTKGALGLGFGIPGARVSVNTRGQIHASAGIPGTGLYQVERSSLNAIKGRRKKVTSGDFVEQIPQPSLFASREKKALYRALREEGVEALKNVALRFPDISYICEALIFPHLLTNPSLDLKTLRGNAEALWTRRSDLEGDPLFYEYAKGYEVTLTLAPGVSVPMQYGLIALGLAYIELLQLDKDFEKALTVAESLPANQATALAVCENEIQLERWQAALETTEEIENVDDATALLLIYRGIALRETGFPDAAIETFRLARSSKRRHEDILNKALFERAITHTRIGKRAQAKKDLEKILATDSSFPGVASLLKEL